MSKLSIVLCAAVLVAGPQWPTLRLQFETRGLPVAGIDDLDRTVTSFAVDEASGWFAIAYYWFDAADPKRLPSELRIRAYDRGRGRWTSAVLDGNLLKTGAAMGLKHQAGWVYLDTHLSPSAGALLVLTDDLKVRRRLYGWSEMILPDGRVVYHDSMVHFAPAHPGSLSLYRSAVGP